MQLRQSFAAEAVERVGEMGGKGNVASGVINPSSEPNRETWDPNMA
jgi:hypothetical protein